MPLFPRLRLGRAGFSRHLPMSDPGVSAAVMHRASVPAGPGDSTPAPEPVYAPFTGSVEFRCLFEASLNPLMMIDSGGRIIDVNTALLGLSGFSRSELVGTDFPILFSTPDRALNGLSTALRTGAVRDGRLELRHRDGSFIPVLFNASPYRDPAGRVFGVLFSSRDARALYRAECELNRANRALRAISACNQAIMHAAAETPLLQQVCQAVVAQTGYLMTWVGFAEDDELKSVRPVAVAGDDGGYVADARVSWADTERGRGPTGTAIRTGRTTICQNMLTDPRFAPWREAARQRGLASSIVLPLKQGERTFGALSIYAAEPDAFDTAEAKLLRELADDLAFGLVSLRERIERQRAEVALEASERSFRTLAESVPLVVWSARAEGWLNYFNRRWSDYTGLSLAQSCGAGWEATVHPDDLARVRGVWRQAAPVAAIYSLEVRLRRADGAYRWWLVRGAPVLDDAGRILKWFGTCTDIDELKRAQAQIQSLNIELERRVGQRTRELRERMAELQTIFDTAPIGFALADDPTCRHIRGNRPLERMFGLPEGAEISLEAPAPHPYRIFAAGAELPPAALPMQRAACGETVTGQLLEVATADGRFIHVFSSATPLRDEAGQPRGVIGAFLDITELKHAEDALRRSNEDLRLQAAQLASANQELEAFSYSVSHDLRAPLRAIDGFGRILLRDQGAQLDAKGQENLQRIRAATQRMGLLIDDLLRLSRTARAEFHLRPVDLAAIARSVAAELQATDPARQVTWRIASRLPAQGDAALLRAALENLLGNAWKFTGRRPEACITVDLVLREGEPVFFVRDNGAGFDMQYAAKLFGPFQRLHAQEEFPGTGIGLATVQRIVHRHGGRVWAEGAVDAGATVYFTLPDIVTPS